MRMETIIACKTCGLVQRLDVLEPGTSAECYRCGWLIGKRMVNSLGRVAAFSLAALIFYVPANIFPILRMEYYGAYSENTVWEGCVRLFQDGQWFVAIIVFLASILIPFVKLVGLFFLVVTTKYQSSRWQRERTLIYKVIDVIGPWAMLDVFLLSVLVALVKLQRIATVLPGRALLAFTAVVVFTLLASATFDPTTIWEQPRAKHHE
jgi:paraquat-inducible protein A